MATAYPTIIYGQSSKIDTSPRLIETSFGDGHQQVTPDGINYLPRSGQLEHPLIDNATSATLLSFLRANSGGQVVSIINYMEDPTGATTLNVRIKSWSKQQDGITNNYTVNFVEAFSS
jgi:phage-related protein